MPAEEEVIPHGNEVFAIEVRGFDHIPEPERNMTPRQVDQLWVGTSVNLLSFALGAMAITLGLNLWWALMACALGSLTYAYMAFGSIVTVRAGLPVTTLARAAFGMLGNLPNALLAWLASVAFEVINTIFGVDALLSLFRLLGWGEPGDPGKVIAVILQLMLCGGIAVLGHATMVWFQRVFAVLIGAALLLVMAFTVGQVDWPHAALPHARLGSASVLGAFLTAAAVIASNPISFLFNGPDWVRYLPSRTAGRSIFAHVFWASYIPSLALTAMGALCATLGDMSDPVGGMKPFIPPWLFLLYILAVVGGSLANNVPTYYSSGLSLQAIGLKVHRYVATLFDLIASTAIALYILFVRDFSTALNDFIALLVLWVGPFGGVWIGDALLRRARYDFRSIHGAAGASGRYWGWGGVNPSGCLALLAGMAVAALTMRSPLYDGRLAVMLGGADLSWLLGFPVSMLTYLGLAAILRQSAGAAATAAVRIE
ncbi:MAG TPA: cytosine permease [Steroidobacteraceae bacterium]|nr:cytosine permease [Steroidobacteraceae bacterium]